MFASALANEVPPCIEWSHGACQALLTGAGTPDDWFTHQHAISQAGQLRRICQLVKQACLTQRTLLPFSHRNQTNQPAIRVGPSPPFGKIGRFTPRTRQPREITSAYQLYQLKSLCDIDYKRLAIDSLSPNLAAFLPSQPDGRWIKLLRISKDQQDLVSDVGGRIGISLHLRQKVPIGKCLALSLAAACRDGPGPLRL